MSRTSLQEGTKFKPCLRPPVKLSNTNQQLSLGPLEAMHSFSLLFPFAFGIVATEGYVLRSAPSSSSSASSSHRTSRLPVASSQTPPESSSPSSSSSPNEVSTSFTASDVEETGIEMEIDVIAPPQRNVVVMSQSIPFLRCPAPLVNCDYAGNVGFDPLGLAKNKEQLDNYREAEIKHARLAMLAAAGWPLSELFDRQIAAYFGVSPVLDLSDRAPSILNGGLDQVSPVWWGFCLGLTAAIDLYGVSKSREGSSDYFPGKLGFDPLGLYPPEEQGRKRMELAEIKHGRLAMVAVVGYVVQEYVTKIGVVDETPFFFEPITESVPEIEEFL